MILKSCPTFGCSWLSWFLFWNWWILSVVVDAEPLWSSVCQQGHPAEHLPFCNATLPLDQRVEDYIHRIPVENQTAMMSHPAAGYDPLGIPPYQWWSEGLHGPLEPCVQWKNETRCPTSFPCPSGLGNAFNTTLYHAIGSAIGIEGRAISNLRNHDMSIGDGLTYWSPNVNLQRDPRWGRNQEAPGEDPLLTSLYARHFVQGLQQPSFSKNLRHKVDDHDHDDSIYVAACCKHFVANSLEHWEGYSRHTFDAKVSQADLHNYYYRPFEECVRAGAAGVMCSYNAVNGIPACIHPALLTSTLRQEWGFDGYLVTDCGALADTISGHGAAKDPIDASAKAKEASVDVNCGNVFREGLLAAYQSGQIQASTIVESFRRLARIQFRLGLFDAKQYNPDHDIQVVGSHIQLALEAALQSIVLLKNERGILPLDPEQTLAMIGPHINARGVFLSNYNGSPCPGPNYDDCIQSPYEAFSKVCNHPISSITGCHVGDSDLDEIEEALELARDADRVVLFVGLDGSQEQEELDRIETVLPGLQRQLVRAVLDVAPDKTIIVLIHGGAVSLGDDVLSDAAAILSASYGGVKAAQALADVVFGRYNPTGKLAATVYPPSYVHEIPLTEMGLSVGVGRTHMYYSGTPEFAFGHGLSYSTWAIDWIQGISKQPLVLEEPQSSLTLQVNVTNLGPKTGSQSILVFWRLANDDRIRQKLAGFQGTSLLDVGQSKILEFVVTHQMFGLWDDEFGRLATVAGLYELEARTASSVSRLYIHVAPSQHTVPASSTRTKR